MRSAGSPLHHEGITLRRWRTDDVETLYRVVQASLEHLSPWMAWVTGGYSERDAAEFVERTQLDWESGAAFNYAIVDGETIGACSLMARIGPGGLEVGYWVHPAHTGRGVASRAAAALTAEAFRVGADRAEIVTDVANTRSAAIPKRLGFVEVDRRPPQEPITPGEVGTDIVWRRSP